MSTDTSSQQDQNQSSSHSQHPIRWVIGNFAKPHAPYIFFGLIATFLARLLWLYPTVVFGQTINNVLSSDTQFSLLFVPDTVLPTGQVSQILFSAVVIASAFVVGSVLMVLGSWTRTLAAYRIQHEIRTGTYENVQSQPISFFDNEHSADLMSIMNNDVNQLHTFFSDTLKSIGQSLFIITGVGFYMTVLHWQLALVTFIAPVLIFVINYYYNEILSPKYLELRQNVSDINNVISNNLSGMDIVKIYNKEQEEKERIEASSEAYRDVSWSVEKLQIAMGQISGRVTDIGDLLVFIVGGIWVVSGPPLMFTMTLEAGTLVTFFIFVRQFNWPLHQIPTIIDEYQEASAASGRVMGIYGEPDDNEYNEGNEALNDVDGSVRYSDVCFSYENDDSSAVDDVSFDVEAGETIGIVGLTGAGKSTMMKLLPRFYQPDSGSIRIDDTDIQEVDVESLRQHIGYVGQNPYIFEGTIADNIGYSSPNWNSDDIESASKLVGAHTFISGLDEGYGTEVGEEGETLSGGQRQRISLARAIYNNPEILILDEATSHVDNITESYIRNNLQEYLEERTVFIIAHRISSVRDANRIFVMEEGNIIERGTHQQLLDQEGVFAALWWIQTGEFDKISPRQYQKLSHHSSISV